MSIFNPMPTANAAGTLPGDNIMWLFTRHGFYSVTVSTDDPSMMQVRARSHKHLLNLIANVLTPMLGDANQLNGVVSAGISDECPRCGGWLGVVDDETHSADCASCSASFEVRSIGSGEVAWFQVADEPPEILHTPSADYAWRIIITPQTWCHLARELAAEVNYPNFKGHCYGRFNTRWMELLHQVWSVMHAYQMGTDAPDDRDEIDPSIWHFDG